MRLALLAAAVAAVGLAPDGAAQYFGITQRTQADYATGMTGGVAGHFFGDPVLDGALLVDGVPSVLMAPEIHTGRFALPRTDVVDLGSLPSDSGGPDSVLTLGASGLESWTWNGGSASFEVRHLAAWGTSTRLGVSDLDGDGLADIFALDPGAGVVHALLNEGAGSFTSLTDMGPMLGTGADVVPVRWKGTGGNQIAVLSDQRLYVVNLQTAVPTVWTILDEYVTASPGHLAAVTVPGTTREGVVMATATPGSAWLAYAHWQQAGAPVFVQTDGDIVGMAPHQRAGQEGGVVLSRSTSDALEVVDVVGASNPTFVAGVSVTIPQWTAFSQNTARPLSADFDQDGDDDIVFMPAGVADEAEGEFARLDFLRGDAAGHLAQCPTIASTKFIDRIPTGETALMGVTFEAAAATTLPELEVIVWHQPRFDAYLDSTPFDVVRVPLSGSDSYEVVIDTGAMDFLEDIYVLEVRMVDSTTGAVGPGRSFAVALEEPLARSRSITGALGLIEQFSPVPGVDYAPPVDVAFPPINPNPIYSPEDEVYSSGNIHVGVPKGAGAGETPDIPEPPPSAPPDRP